MLLVLVVHFAVGHVCDVHHCGDTEDRRSVGTHGTAFTVPNNGSVQEQEPGQVFPLTRLPAAAAAALNTHKLLPLQPPKRLPASVFNRAETSEAYSRLWFQSICRRSGEKPFLINPPNNPAKKQSGGGC